MKELEKLLDRIIQRININLRELDYDVRPYIKDLVRLLLGMSGWHEQTARNGHPRNH